MRGRGEGKRGEMMVRGGRKKASEQEGIGVREERPMEEEKM